MKKNKEIKETEDKKKKRINECVEAINKILEEYACRLQVSVAIQDRQIVDSVNVVSK